MAKYESAMEAVAATAKYLAERGNNTEKELRQAMWESTLRYPDGADDEMSIHRYIEHEVNEIMQQEMKKNPHVDGHIHVDGVDVTIDGVKDMTLKEVRNYVSSIKEWQCSPDSELNTLVIRPVEDAEKRKGMVDLDYSIRHRQFERIRRITGYLVGTIDRWNNAKRAEEHDRVKHGLMNAR